MPNSRDIKRRISGVKSTGQITKAMKLVASSKVTRAKNKVLTNRYYFENLKAAVNVAMSAGKVDSPFIIDEQKKLQILKDSGQKKRVLYIVLSSDKGLCGGFNINLFKELAAHVSDENENYFAISGKKARDYCKRKNYEVVFAMEDMSEDPLYEDAKDFGNFAINKYLNKEIDEVYLVYTHFKSVIAQEPKVFKLLPFDANAHMEEIEEEQNNEKNRKEERLIKPLTLYEPSQNVVLNYVIPKYTHGVIYGALLESAASELGSRMTAMDNATTNANDIVANLTLTYNRIRQSGITTEISEIVGGANALNA